MWDKREPIQNMVFLGDGEGQIPTVGGLLVGIQKNRKYPDKDDYYIVRRSGEEVVLGGNATLARQISSEDVGRFIKCQFKGWEKGGKGSRFKLIDVYVWKGEFSDEMKAWPRFAEFQAPKAPTPQPQTAAAVEEDDELPF